MIVRIAAQQGKRHDRGVERTLRGFLACRQCGSWWESRCAHPPVPVTHPPWEGLGWEENCASQEGCVRVLLQGEERPSVPRGRRMSQRAGGEAVFPACSGRKCLPAPSRAPSFVLVHFPGGESHFHGCRQSGVLGTQLRKMPGGFWLPGRPTAQQVWLHTPHHDLAY